jgi:hypothetical protein
MNAYTTTGQARIQPRDIAAVQRAHRYMIGASLAALEQQRGWQAEAEVDWLLRQGSVEPDASTARVSTLRQTIGAALIRAGCWLADIPRSGVSSATGPAAGTIGTAS